MRRRRKSHKKRHFRGRRRRSTMRRPMRRFKRMLRRAAQTKVISGTLIGQNLVGAQAAWTVADPFNTLVIAQGADRNTRIGDRVFFKRLTCRFYFVRNIIAVNEIGVRFAVCKSLDGQGPAATDLPSVLSLISNWPTQLNMKVLYDKVKVLGNNTHGTLTAKIKWSIPLNFTFTFPGAAASAMNDISKKIYFCVWPDQSAMDSCLFDFSYRLSYKDV